MDWIIYYFGNEYEWNGSDKYQPSKRRSCLFYAVSQETKVKRNYLVKKVDRKKFLLNLPINIYHNAILQRKTGNVFFTVLFPERIIFDALNRAFAKLSVFIQTFPHAVSTRRIKWCYWPHHYKHLKYLRLKGYQVFDVDHNIIDDPNTEDSIAMSKYLVQIGNESNLILSSARSMISWFEDRGVHQSVRVRNGVDPRRFENINQRNSVEVDFRSKPVVGYCGTISQWIDMDLFYELVRRSPMWNFVVIGDSYKNEMFDPYALPNLHWMGKRSPTELPGLLYNFDVALGLYQKDRSWLDVDSMKLFEYLAAGVPVVSTPFHSWIKKDFDDLILLADTADEFRKNIEIILNRDELQKENFKRKAGDFVRKNTWSKRVEELLSNINAIK